VAIALAVGAIPAEILPALRRGGRG
jgi:hypothetical protein